MFDRARNFQLMYLRLRSCYVLFSFLATRLSNCSATIVSEAGKRLEGQCTFPFLYKEKLRFECVTRNDEGKKGVWCPTAPANDLFGSKVITIK